MPLPGIQESAFLDICSSIRHTSSRLVSPIKVISVNFLARPSADDAAKHRIGEVTRLFAVAQNAWALVMIAEAWTSGLVLWFAE